MNEKIVIYKEELIPLDSILEWLKTCDKGGIGIDDLKDLKNSMMDISRKLILDCNMFIEEGLYGSNSDDIILKLGRFRLYLSSLQGLGEALIRKLQTVSFNTLSKRSKDPNIEEKYTQAQMDNISKMEVAALEGMVSILKTTLQTIRDREFMIQGRKNKPW